MKILTLLTCLLMSVLSACTSNPEKEKAETISESELPAFRQLAEGAVREVDALRSSLAGTIDMGKVDAGTFARVCKPVGMRAREIGEENGWVFRQVAVKYRNPGNEADDEAALLFPRFERSLDSLWVRSEHDGNAGWRYLRRITVEPACLACHGSEEARPSFVLSGYPEDKAFGFNVGDLRGLYSVFVPDSSQISLPE